MRKCKKTRPANPLPFPRPVAFDERPSEYALPAPPVARQPRTKPVVTKPRGPPAKGTSVAADTAEEPNSDERRLLQQLKTLRASARMNNPRAQQPAKKLTAEERKAVQSRLYATSTASPPKATVRAAKTARPKLSLSGAAARTARLVIIDQSPLAAAAAAVAAAKAAARAEAAGSNRHVQHASGGWTLNACQSVCEFAVF